MEQTPALAETLYRHLRDLTRLVRAESSGDLSVTAASVLLRLREDGPQRVTDLAAAERVTQPSMTTLVRRLESRGLVSREADPGDARASHLSVTDEGADALAAVARARTRVLAERLEALEPEARARIAAALPELGALLR